MINSLRFRDRNRLERLCGEHGGVVSLLGEEAVSVWLRKSPSIS